MGKRVSNQEIAAMIITTKYNDFAPAIYNVVDYRNVRVASFLEPVRDETRVPSIIAYYEDKGYICEVRENRGDFMDTIQNVIIVTHNPAQHVSFRSWGAAAAYVRSNYTALAAARTAFYANAD